MSTDRMQLIRKAIEEAKPAEEYFAEQAKIEASLAKRELISIAAVVAYVAHTHKVSDEVVLSMLASHFGVNDVCNIQRRHYDAAIRYLVDLNPQEQIN